MSASPTATLTLTSPEGFTSQHLVFGDPVDELWGVRLDRGLTARLTPAGGHTAPEHTWALLCSALAGRTEDAPTGSPFTLPAAWARITCAHTLDAGADARDTRRAALAAVAASLPDPGPLAEHLADPHSLRAEDPAYLSSALSWLAGAGAALTWAQVWAGRPARLLPATRQDPPGGPWAGTALTCRVSADRARAATHTARALHPGSAALLDNWFAQAGWTGRE